MGIVMDAASRLDPRMRLLCRLASDVGDVVLHGPESVEDVRLLSEVMTVLREEVDRRGLSRLWSTVMIGCGLLASLHMDDEEDD